MNMQHLLKVLRYFVFGSFIVCNAIIASVAVWNLSLSRAYQQEVQVSSYLTFVGASGLVWIFALVFLELAEKASITGRIWFECTWVGIYWLLDLAGASALSAIGPQVTCDKSKVARVLIKDACASTQVLLAFSWISTIILMGYFSMTVISTLILYQRDTSIWQCHVQDFPFKGHCMLLSAPSSPIVAKFSNPTPRASLAAPKPTRPPRMTAIYNARLSEYAVEQYQPPTTFAQPAPPPIAYSARRQEISPSDSSPLNLYPEYVQSSFMHISPLSSETPQREQPPSPLPLGKWPRADIISQPTRSRPRSQAPALVTTVQSVGPGSAQSPDSALPRPRLTGSRVRGDSSSGGRRLPRLDMSNVGAHGSGARQWV